MTLRVRFLVETCDEKGIPLVGQDREVFADAEVGELLTQVAYRAGVVIQQTCGGTPSCTDCRITVKEGTDRSFVEMEHAEKTLMGNVYFITKERLACQARVQESCTLWVPNPKRYRKKQQQRKR